MRSIEEVEREISVLRSMIISKKRLNKKASTKWQQDKILFLKEIILYLHTNPSIEYLQRELVRLDELIYKLKNRWDEFVTLNPISDHKELKSVFNKETELPKYKHQSKIINYILNNNQNEI